MSNWTTQPSVLRSQMFRVIFKQIYMKTIASAAARYLTNNAQLMFSTYYIIMPLFEWTWHILFHIINMYKDLKI